MKKTKVLVIGDTPPPYTGCNVLLQQLLNSDLNKRFDLIFLDISDRRPNETRGRFDLSNVVLALYHSVLLTFMIARHRPEVVYLPLSQGLWGFVRDAVFINLAWLMRRRVIVHFHGSGFGEFYERNRRPIQLLIQSSLKHISLLIVLAERLKPIFDGLVDREIIRVVYNGIDAKELEAGECDSKNDNKIVKILYLSKKSKAKGIYDLLESIPLVIHKEKSVRFILAGDSMVTEEFPWHTGHVCHTGAEITEFIRENDLADVIDMSGEVTGVDKSRLFAEADIFVLPSYSEGMPIVILEAMAAGLPIVATLVGALPEIIDEGKNGFLVEVGNYEDLANKILILVKDRSLRQQLGGLNRKVVSETFSSKKYVEGLERVFLELSMGK